jgi:GMP reductase
MAQQLDYDDVLISPVYQSPLSSRSEVEMICEYKTHSGTVGLSPVMAANMDGVGTFRMADVLRKNGILTCLTKHYSRHDLVDYLFRKKLESDFNAPVSMTIGMSDHDFEKFEYVHKAVGLDFLTIDVANGHMEKFARYVDNIRTHHPHLNLIVGNVASAETFSLFQDIGAWAVKVGIGPGAHCATREKTGVGRKMVSLIEEVSEVASSTYVIADGGCKSPGDVAKALVAGADFVMLGTMFAGHTEGGGEPVLMYERTGEYEVIKAPTRNSHGEYREIIRAVEYRQFYGMSSDVAMEKHHGGMANHRTSEGKVSLVPFKAGVQSTIDDIFGGLRSTCTYTGVSNPQHLFMASFDRAL